MDMPPDRHEAENCLAGYTDVLNRRDFAALTALVADATVPPAGTIGGGRTAVLMTTDNFSEVTDDHG